MTDQWCARRDVPAFGDVARLLAGVPEWFGREDVNAAYVVDARELETWTVRDARGVVVGVTLVTRHFPHVAEVHLMVVERAHHGRGVESAMPGKGVSGCWRSKPSARRIRILAMPAPVGSTKKWDFWPWRKPTCGVRTPPA